jgi:hypothetical protein
VKTVGLKKEVPEAMNMTILPVDLTVELRSADGMSTEFYEADEERIQETLRLLANPRLLVQPHLMLASEDCASMIPCKGIDMILARTPASTPLKFPLVLPAGLFDIVEKPEGWANGESAVIEDPQDRDPGRARRHTAQVEIHTLGGWTVTLKVVAVGNDNVQDERQFFAHLRNVPAIPFRLEEGGFGLINPMNITRASAWPKPDWLPELAVPLALRRWSPSLRRGGEPAPGMVRLPWPR